MSEPPRPRIVTHNVSSIDGKVGLPGVLLVEGDERWSAIGGYEATDMWALHDPQVRLEGSGSFVAREALAAELPPVASDVDLHADFLPDRVVTPRRRFYAVVDGRGRVRWTQKTGEHDEHLMILVSRGTPSGYLAFLRDENIPYIVAGEERVDLPRVLGILHARLGVSTVVATGGGLLNGALLRGGLVDEVDIDFLPGLIGGGAPTLFEGALLRPNESPASLSPITIEPKPSGGIFVRYAVRYRV
jgi:2,5-diamino-6-(ribosylamino)-4(3H)-pyrimidinone 5'-phosphate reductase